MRQGYVGTPNMYFRRHATTICGFEIGRRLGEKKKNKRNLTAGQYYDNASTRVKNDHSARIIKTACRMCVNCGAYISIYPIMREAAGWKEGASLAV